MVNKEKRQAFSEYEVWTSFVHFIPLLYVASITIGYELCPPEIFGLVTSLHLARIHLCNLRMEPEVDVTVFGE